MVKGRDSTPSRARSARSSAEEREALSPLEPSEKVLQIEADSGRVAEPCVTRRSLGLYVFFIGVTMLGMLGDSDTPRGESAQVTRTESGAPAPKEVSSPPPNKEWSAIGGTPAATALPNDVHDPPASPVATHQRELCENAD